MYEQQGLLYERGGKCMNSRGNCMNVGVSLLLHKKIILKGNWFITFISAPPFKLTPEPFNAIQSIQIR